MKKLIIAAAFVCAAMVSQAAKYNWQASSVKDIDGVATYSGAATLFATTMDGDAVGSWSGTMSNGSISKVIDDTVFTVGQTYKFYYTMTDAKGNSFTSVTKPGKAQSTATQALAFGSGGTWTAIPEPTSGLLLLIGVAGLALRRKQK